LGTEINLKTYRVVLFVVDGYGDRSHQLVTFEALLPPLGFLE
jgi:hypothetical protein